MHTIQRAGIVTGIIAGMLVFGLQRFIGPVSYLLVSVTGMFAGVIVAKWLDYSWYGRQAEAGLRSGAIASGIAGISVLVTAVLSGFTAPPLLAGKPSLFAHNTVAASVLHQPVGQTLLTLFSIIMAIVLGALLGALSSQIGGWTKSSRTVKVIEQARLAALEVLQTDQWQTPMRRSGSHHQAGFLSQTPGVDLIRGGEFMATSPVLPALPGSTLPQVSREIDIPAIPQTTVLAEEAHHHADTDDETTEAGPELQLVKGRGARRRSSRRSVDDQLTEQMKSALASWARENEIEVVEPAAQNSRTPKPSTYLNSAPPAPRRSRKKQNTRDWLC